MHTAGTALLGWTNMRLLVLSQKSDEQVRLSHTTVHHQRISRYIKKLLISLDTFLYRPVFESAATQQIFSPPLIQIYLNEKKKINAWPLKSFLRAQLLNKTRSGSLQTILDFKK